MTLFGLLLCAAGAAAVIVAAFAVHYILGLLVFGCALLLIGATVLDNL